MAEANSGTVDRIVSAACAALGELGLHGVTIGVVADRAGVSTALVHYHFDTKAQLLVAAADRIAAQRADRRAAALAAERGLAALDALWSSIESSVNDGAARGHLELILCSREDAAVATALAGRRSAEIAELQRRIPLLMRELGTAPHAAPDEMAAAVDAALDGLVIALLGGQRPEAVRAAYDAFWLSLIAAGQSRRR